MSEAPESAGQRPKARRLIREALEAALQRFEAENSEGNAHAEKLCRQALLQQQQKAQAHLPHRYCSGQVPSKHNMKLSSHWFEFGTHPDGRVDLADDDGDLVVACPKSVAVELIELRQRFIDKVAEILARVSGSRQHSPDCECGECWQQMER